MKKAFFIILISTLCGFVSAQDLEQITKEKPVDFSGSISANAGFYQVSGIDPRQGETTWSISGNPTLRIYGFELPFAFTVGRFGSRLTYPTFNQFGVSPHYKWATLHLGYRNMTFSPYTLAGHTFLGAGIELNPGIFRFSAMYGRLQEAAKLDSTQYYYQTPTFRRMGYGIKMGLGTERTYVDLIYFRAKDDANSLQLPDSVRGTPGENLVVGLSGRLALGKHFNFFADGAISTYTRNLGSKEVSTDSFPWQLKAAATVFTPRYSTRGNFAGKAGMNWSQGTFNLQLGYERIDPEYQTMGSYFFSNDLENYTIAPSWSMAKGKVRVSGSYGLQRNDLLGTRSEKSFRNIGSLNISANPSPSFGVDFNYANFSMRQSSGNVELKDSIRLAMVTNNFSLTPRFNILKPNVVHTFLLNVNYQFLDDKNPYTEQYGDMNSWLFLFSHSFMLPESGWSVSTTLNYYTIHLNAVNTAFYGLTSSLGKSFFDNKLSTGISANYNVNLVNQHSDGATINLNGNLSFSFYKRHSLSLSAGWLHYQSDANPDFSEFRGNVGYVFVFR